MSILCSYPSGSCHRELKEQKVKGGVKAGKDEDGGAEILEGLVCYFLPRGITAKRGGIRWFQVVVSVRYI
jgi:hypothetical protein